MTCPTHPDRIECWCGAQYDYLTRDNEPIKVIGYNVWVLEDNHWYNPRISICIDTQGYRCEHCSTCSLHCQCPTCPDCNDKCESVCERCDKGEGCCCECPACVYCGERFDRVCERCQQCADHCNHTECASCGRLRYSDDICGNCDTCQTHCCTCTYCSNCGERGDLSICGNCDYCRGCCECSNGLLRIRPREIAWHGRRNDKCGPKRYVSAEIEVSSTEDDAVSGIINRWHGAIVDDGSLGSAGSEINTAPARGRHWREQITEICGGLRASGAKVDKSCGLHVHVDARDLTYYDIRRLIKLYARIEPALFTLVSESRRSGNDYCLPCASRYLQALSPDSKARETKLGVIAGIYQTIPDRRVNTRQWKGDKYNPARYNALNLHTWIYRGTLECRLHQGTTDPRKILLWGELWSHIVEYVASHTDKQIDALPNLPSYDKNLQFTAESYEILKNHVCAGMPELQDFMTATVVRLNSEISV